MKLEDFTICTNVNSLEDHSFMSPFSLLQDKGTCFSGVNFQVWATRNTQPHPRNIFAVHITCKLVPVQFSLRTGFPGKWWILAGCTQLFLALSACCSQRPSFVLPMLPTVAHPQTSDMVVTVEGVSVIFALVPSWDTGATTDIAYKDGRTPFAITATGRERTGQSLLPCVYVSAAPWYDVYISICQYNTCVHLTSVWSCL